MLHLKLFVFVFFFLLGVTVANTESKQSHLVLASDTYKGMASHAIFIHDSLGYINLFLPEAYDTTFSWVHFSDCYGCAQMKVRFQSECLDVYQENGFHGGALERPDSIDQLTIVYSWLNDFSDNEGYDWVEQYKNDKVKYKKGLETSVVLDSLVWVDDHLFTVIIYCFVPSRGGVILDVYADTHWRGNPIRLHFERYSKVGEVKEHEFIAECLKTIKSCSFGMENLDAQFLYCTPDFYAWYHSGK